MNPAMHSSFRLYREALLNDPYRPAYHFAIPDGNGYPGDANGAFYADGRYHLMYLYKNETTQAFHWGHMSSRDLINWRHHPDALTQENGDMGAFSGGAFVDDDGTAYLSFWKFPAKDQSDRGGIALARAKAPYEKWERMYPLAIPGGDHWGAVDIEVDGEIRHIACADPSNIWKKDGWYYIQCGNLEVLNPYGRDAGSEEIYRGDWTDLFRSSNLSEWTYVGRFYQNDRRGQDGLPDDSEDDMCPSFLPLPDKKCGGQLTDKYLQLFIAHNRGAQYYIGSLEGESFVPIVHGRFSWTDRTLFAPEALIDGRNRQLVWCWLLGNPDKDVEKYGWSGVYNFPRCLWYEDGALHMAPAEELDTLMTHPGSFRFEDFMGRSALPVPYGDSFRLKMRARPVEGASPARIGVTLREDLTRGERTDIYYDPDEGALVMDARKSGLGEGFDPTPLAVEKAPLCLKDGEALNLDIFVDKSVVEVYANERQAICRRIYPTDPAGAMGVSVFADAASRVEGQFWRMEPSNPY